MTHELEIPSVQKLGSRVQSNGIRLPALALVLETFGYCLGNHAAREW